MTQIANTRQIPIDELFPTQITVGMREVNDRRMRWREKSPDKAAHYLSTHQVPVILGPGGRHYMIDRHHLTRALQEEGIETITIAVVDDFRERDFENFWTTLEQYNWAHPFDD